MGSTWGYRRSATAFMVFVFMGLLAAFPYFEQIRSANELPRLMQGKALVEDGALVEIEGTAALPPA